MRNKHLLISLLTGFLVACGGGGGGSSTGSFTFGSNASDPVPKKAYAAFVSAFEKKSGDKVTVNTSDHNSEAGILLQSGTTGTLVSGNTTFANARGYTRAAPGIDVRSTGNTVQDNVSHDNEDSGLQFYTGGGGNLVLDNLSYRNGDHGIDDLNAPGQTIIGNTVYGNVAAGINLEGTSSGGTLANNVSVLRPEVMMQYMATRQGLIGRGLSGDIAGALTQKMFAGRAMLQGTVVGFDKTFILQVIAFLATIPLLVFLRVKRTGEKAHVELSVE